MRPLEYLKKWFVNFGMIKLVMILLVMYLIYEELLLYWKIKPTQTSVSELKIADVQNPNIFICKSPEYDNTMFRYFKSLLWRQVPSLIINSISQHGYTDAYWYSQGKNIKRKFVGWSGNTSLDPEDLLEDILALKSNGSMPYVMLKLKDRNGGIWFEHRNLTVRVKT